MIKAEGGRAHGLPTAGAQNLACVGLAEMRGLKTRHLIEAEKGRRSNIAVVCLHVTTATTRI